jgi:protein-L-isoaspartate(D-aspartate) O-methyltransferase
MLEDNGYPVSFYLKKFVEMLKSKGIKNKNVLEIFAKIDRKYFLNYSLDEENGYPYNDVPKPIGWNTTISAPSMHAETLSYLYENLKNAKSILDIGTGSGYMTAAMAYLCPPGAKIYAVDHIKEINEFAENNIKNICPYLLRKHSVYFVTQDGRRGLKEYQG